MLKHAPYQAISTPLPLQQIVGGLIQAANHNKNGHFSYLLGETSSTGWWYVFPVVLLVKTPIPSLLLALAGITHGLAKIRIAKWQQVLTALFPIAIQAFCMTVRINLGVRHLLVLFIPLAVLAAHAMHKLMARYPGYIGRVAVVLLVLSTLGSTLLAQPDNLAYFNFLAGRNPEKILSESDLDWGQDLYRLRDRFKQLGSPEVAVAYFGSQPLASSGIEDYTILSPKVPTAGYVAISLRFSVMEFKEFGRYQWLQQYRPIERVGKSIDLYYINLAGPDLR